jgi:TolB-like protein
MVVSADPTAGQIRAAVRRIQAGAGLAGAPTLKQLLEHTVELTLGGRAAEIKESTLAVEVFGRKTSFDPRSDPIVRVQARKLRERLAAWYKTDGTQDEVVIEYVRGSYVPHFSLRSSVQPQARSVAVLPFRDLSDTAALDYVCEGIAEELRYVLSRTHGIRVVAHESSNSQGRRTEDIQTLGTMLNTDLIVRGTVRSLGSALRITAELIDAGDGFLVWADRWERPTLDVLRLSYEIAATVAGALRSGVGAPAGRTSTHNREAHDLYLKGRFYWNHRTEHGFRRAIEHYEAALACDPQFARVHAGLADSWMLLSAHHLDEPMSCLKRASAYAREAVRLDPELAAAHSALAATLLFYDRKPHEAEKAWKRALQLDPNYAYAWHGLSVFGSFVWGRLNEALAAIEQARQLEPLSAPVACDVGFTLYANGMYEDAVEACHTALDMHRRLSASTRCPLKHAFRAARSSPAVRSWDSCSPRRPTLMVVSGARTRRRVFCMNSNATRPSTLSL